MEDFIEKFNNWNVKKQEIHFSERTNDVYFKERQIWWCSVGQNIGSESYGKGEDFRRPILIYKKLSADLCVALPMTSREKKDGSWFIDVTFGGQKAWVLLYQIRVFNKKRFQRKIGELDGKDFLRVKQKLEKSLELSQ